MILPLYVPGCPCPCGCGATGSKLGLKTGHVAGACLCRPCIGARSQRKGKAGQAKMHRALGGEGFTPSNEESARPYIVEVTVMPESKAGEQVPELWHKFRRTEWFRRALAQSERAVPTGSGVVPALVIDGSFLIADIRGRRRP